MPDARSSAGALGLMQILPATGKYIAGKLNEAEEELRPYLDEAGGKDEDQVTLAWKLEEHLSDTVNYTINNMIDLRDDGDYCGLRDELERTEKTYRGITDYDELHARWVQDLATEEAKKELAITMPPMLMIQCSGKCSTARPITGPSTAPATLRANGMAPISPRETPSSCWSGSSITPKA